MYRNDFVQIRAMFPCLMNIIEGQLGYLVVALDIYQGIAKSKYSHVVQLAVIERNWDFDVALNSVGLNIFIRRDSTGQLKYKIRRFHYSPTPEFKVASYQMYERLENELHYWWLSVECVISAQDYAAKQVALYKEELISKALVTVPSVHMLS
jgi:hypothetical protein